MLIPLCWDPDNKLPWLLEAFISTSADPASGGRHLWKCSSVEGNNQRRKPRAVINRLSTARAKLARPAWTVDLLLGPRINSVSLPAISWTFSRSRKAGRAVCRCSSLLRLLLLIHTIKILLLITHARQGRNRTMIPCPVPLMRRDGSEARWRQSTALSIGITSELGVPAVECWGSTSVTLGF